MNNLIAKHIYYKRGAQWIFLISVYTYDPIDVIKKHFAVKYHEYTEWRILTRNEIGSVAEQLITMTNDEAVMMYKLESL